MTLRVGKRPLAILWTVVSVALAAGALAVTFRRLDLDRFFNVLAGAEWIWIVLLVAMTPLEQIVRGWKWRQLLYDIQPIATWRLFGAVMAGYFANIVLPIGLSPLIRAWIVAKTETLRFTTVLTTTAIDRFVDGVIFAGFVGVLVGFAALPGGNPDLRAALMVSGLGSLALFVILLAGLFAAKARIGEPESRVGAAFARLESAFGGRLAGLGPGVIAGIIWPRSRVRGAAIVVASVLMKLISSMHFLWAGLTVGVILAPAGYLLLLVVVGFALIISRFVRLPGGDVIGGAFTLKLLDVPVEEALTMVLLVHVASVVTTTAIGSITLWRSGVTLGAVRRGLGQDNR